MAAKFQFFQTNGAGAGVDTPLSFGDGSHDWDFKANDRAGLLDGGLDSPILAGGFSCQVFLRGKFTNDPSGSPFSSIDNVRFYASDLDLAGLGDGAYILGESIEVFPGSPDNQSMSGTWAPIPTDPAGGLDIGTADLVSGNEGFTKYVGLQLKTDSANADPNGTQLIGFTVVYDEV